MGGAPDASGNVEIVPDPGTEWDEREIAMIMFIGTLAIALLDICAFLRSH